LKLRWTSGGVRAGSARPTSTRNETDSDPTQREGERTRQAEGARRRAVASVVVVAGLGRGGKRFAEQSLKRERGEERPHQDRHRRRRLGWKGDGGAGEKLVRGREARGGGAAGGGLLGTAPPPAGHPLAGSSPPDGAPCPHRRLEPRPARGRARRLASARGRGPARGALAAEPAPETGPLAKGPRPLPAATDRYRPLIALPLVSASVRPARPAHPCPRPSVTGVAVRPVLVWLVWCRHLLRPPTRGHAPRRGAHGSRMTMAVDDPTATPAGFGRQWQTPYGYDPCAAKRHRGGFPGIRARTRPRRRRPRLQD